MKANPEDFSVDDYLLPRSSSTSSCRYSWLLLLIILVVVGPHSPPIIPGQGSFVLFLPFSERKWRHQCASESFLPRIFRSFQMCQIWTPTRDQPPLNPRPTNQPTINHSPLSRQLYYHPSPITATNLSSMLHSPCTSSTLFSFQIMLAASNTTTLLPMRYS